jgi:diguanylate cyclase (GGDEF)-like protein/PAS domain S-box-containing protein
MTQWSAEFLRGVLDAAPEGIVICEVAQGGSGAGPVERPLVYANAAFEKLSGYSVAELLGRDLRLLQAGDRDQEACGPLRESLVRGEECRALLRNYRKDGTPFWNELLVQPVRGENGAISHYIGFHRDVSERQRERPGVARSGMPSWQREDRLSGLCSRAYFEELLQHDWLVGQREARMLTLMMFDIDQLATYNDTFGRAAGDACIRRIAGVIGASFRRGADVVGRWEGGRICALVRNPDPATIPAFAAQVVQRVLGQRIHHPRATRQKFVSVSVGAASLNPATDRTSDLLVQAAERALERAKQDPHGQVAMAGSDDIG